jgi:enterochelin esterase-like enzyme
LLFAGRKIKMKKIICIIGSCFACIVATSQTIKPYVLQPDGRVSFTVSAPNAKDVKLAGWDILSALNVVRSGGERFEGLPLQKSANGDWTITVGPLSPAPYQYFYIIDGIRTLDPQNRNILQTAQLPSNVVEINSNRVGIPWERANVPAGSVHHHIYHSKIVGKDRPLVVYTPPGYETNSQKYPVLYLLHGAGEIANSWIEAGKANIISDNLIAAKKAIPCIIVMPLGHSVGLNEPSNLSSLPTEKRLEWMEDELMKTIVPFVESRYRIKKGAANNGIAGLSMGGAQTTYIGLRNFEKFNYISILSSGAKDIEKKYPDFFNRANGKIKFLFIGVGEYDQVGKTASNESGVFYNTIQMHESLEKNGIKHSFRILPKTDHTWSAWRQFLSEDVLPNLWKK